MITLYFVSHVSRETAELLRKVGFDWPSMGYYNKLGFFHDAIPHHDELKAPALDVAQRWLREIHHLHITIFSSSQESWMFRITKPHQKLEDGIYGEDYYTYEEALEASIVKALEIILKEVE